MGKIKSRHFSFRTRLLALMIALVVLAQLAAVVAILKTTSNDVIQRAGEELRVGARVLDQMLRVRGSQLQDSVEILASDFGFKTAIATRDQATIETVLANHGARIGAQLVMLTDVSGHLVASTHADVSKREAFPFPELWQKAQQEGGAASVVTLQGKPYQFVMVPVYAPNLIAWVGMGFPVDDGLAQELKAVTNLDISFIGRSSGTAGSPGFIASTQPQEQRPLVQAVASRGAGLLTQDKPFFTPDGNFLCLGRVLVAGHDESVVALLQVGHDAILAPFDQLKVQLLVIFAVTLAVSVLMAFFTAAAIGRPIQRLTEAASRIGRGEQVKNININEKGEIGVLASTLNAMQEDIAQREAELLYQSLHDGLTGLPNRASVETWLQGLVADAQPFLLVRLCINDFKQVNDTFGYAVGDAVLIEIARRLEQFLGAQERVARIGGDEFLLILQRSAEGLEPLSLELRSMLSQSLHLEHSPVQLSVSLGLVVFPDHGDRPELLLRRSDIALNLAKVEPSRIFCYENGLDESHLRQLTIIQDLRDAIRNSELTLAFQPKVESATAQAGRFEALLRWQHPQLGFIPPDEFVGLAERSGNIRALTNWVIDQVLAQMQRWLEQGEQLSVAINLSAHDLGDESLPAMIAERCQHYGIVPEQLVLEVTEGALMRDPRLTISLLNELKTSGFRISIDDFGTGYSSLAQLKQLPVDELKIDKSFVLKLDVSPEDEVIVRSTIDLGHNLGLKIVAEGVENQASWDILQRYGCDQIQGYFISKPLPTAQVLPWLQEFRQQRCGATVVSAKS